MGARMLRDQLNQEGFTVGRKHVENTDGAHGHGGALPEAGDQQEALGA